MYNSVSLSMRKEVGSELFVLVDSGSVFVVEILYEGLVMWIGGVVGDGLVLFPGDLTTPSVPSSSEVQVPRDMRVNAPCSLASVAAVKSLARWTGSSRCSIRETASALFQMPGQWMTVILNWEMKSLIRSTARLIELCMKRKFKWSENT